MQYSLTLLTASFHTAFGIPQWIMGLVVAVIAIFVFMGGMKRIAKVTETIVPFMAALYIIGSLIVIIYNYKTFLMHLHLFLSEHFHQVL